MSDSTLIDAYTAADRDEVVALWTAAGLTRPWNSPTADIERKVQEQPELFFVARDDEGRVIGTVLGGYDGHRGWIHYLAVDEAHRGRGTGRALLEHAERALLARGCPKVQLQVRLDDSGVVEFYERLGYSRYEVVDLGKRLISDTVEVPPRTS